MALVTLSGLCTMFVLVVTASQAWREHVQAGWPQVTARVDSCSLDRTSSGWRQKFHIHCRLSYAVVAEQNVANIYSFNAPSPEIWQYPPNQIVPLRDWVNEHPQGTPMILHYDPAHHAKVALVVNDMPRGGPRTPSDVKQLEVWIGSFVVLLSAARIMRPRCLAPNGYPPSALDL